MKSRSVKKKCEKRTGTGERQGGEACTHPVPVYQLLIYPLIGQLCQLTSSPSSVVISLSSPRWPTRIVRVILMNPRCLVLWTSVNLRSGVVIIFFLAWSQARRVSATWLAVKMFSLLCQPVSAKFQLFPSLAKAALTLENSTKIVVSPLISIMRDQVEHWI